MPTPSPHAGESHDDFSDRCMGDPVMKDEYPNANQRYAVCEDCWERDDAESDSTPALPRVARAAGTAPRRMRIYSALKGVPKERRAARGVDWEHEVIRGFAIITKGEAVGHGVWIDDAFLDQVVAADGAIAEARRGLAEGGIPIGAALYHQDGRLLGCGHNRRVQEGDPSVHGETDAFRKAGRQRRYRDTIMVTTLAPCWYCSGLVRQFNIGTVVVGESVNFRGGLDWLRDSGVEVIDLQSQECIDLLGDYIRANPEVWNEDIGED